MSQQHSQSILSQTALARLRQFGPGGAAGERPPLFSCELSINEVALLRQVGLEPLGLVMGSSIYHIGYQFQAFSQSQELQVLTQTMYTAREYAMARMEAEADTLAADGIVGVRLDYRRYSWGEDLLEFIAVGTAVRAVDGAIWRTPSGRPFTTDLAGQGVWTLARGGYAPISFVLGTCVYHIAHESFRQMWKTVGQNSEMPNFTQATYDAREIALARMQAEAQRDGAHGILGARIIEDAHVWGDNAIEFLALGGSVRGKGAPGDLVAPSVVLPMVE